MIRITFFRHNCIGCYYCNEVAPYRWEMNEDDGLSDLVDGERKGSVFSLVTTDDELEDNLEAERNCPSGVIRVEEIS